MVQRMISQNPSERLDLPWSWCAGCHRAYMTGSYRLIRFKANTLHPHPAMLKLCPYDDCNASTIRDGWQWATLQFEHPDYPVIPQRDVIYARPT